VDNPPLWITGRVAALSNTMARSGKEGDNHTGEDREKATICETAAR
jgi:hypothetical protein